MLAGPRVAVVLGQRVQPCGAERSRETTGACPRRPPGGGRAPGSTCASPSASAPGPATSSPRRWRRRPWRRSGSHAVAPSPNGHGPPSPFVAVTHVPDRHAQACSCPLGSPAPAKPSTSRVGRRRPRRPQTSRLSCPGAVLRGWRRLPVPGHRHHHRLDRDSARADNAPALSGPGLRVLLVDPEADPDHSPRPMVEAVVAVARRCWRRARGVAGRRHRRGAPRPLSGQARRRARRGPRRGPSFGVGHESHYGWDRPARITRALRETRDAGRSPSAWARAPRRLAVCVEQGAVGLLHTDLLAQELARQAARRLNTNGGGSQNGYEDARGPGQLPAPYNSLVHLTPSERRVLFHMMEGRSAAEIADHARGLAHHGALAHPLHPAQAERQLSARRGGPGLRHPSRPGIGGVIRRPRLPSASMPRWLKSMQ